MNLSKIPPFAIEGTPREPRGVNCIIETPLGSGSKFAWNKEYEIFEFSRNLRAGFRWPCDFGFVPNTIAGDGDALDIALIADQPMFPGLLIRCRVIGGIGLVKNGEENDRILAVPARSSKAPSRFDDIDDLSDLLPRQIREIEAFLSDYNTFEGHTITLTGWQNAEKAFENVKRAVEAAKGK